MIEGPKNAPPAHAERAEPEMEQGALSCPSCRAQGQRHWGRRDGHDMWACTECGLVYFPRPIVQTYDYQDYYPYLRGFDEPRIKWELAVRRSKYVGQLKIIRRNAPQASTLLDVGAGPGYFTRVANECGFSARGVEPSLEARRAGRDHYGVSYVELDEVQDDSIDVLTCHHVLEHVEWPQDFLALLRRKLKKGGLLVLHVPNQQPMSFRLRQILSGGRGDTHCSLYYPIHVNGFTSRSLVATVERQPFKVVAVTNASMWSVYYDPFFLANYFCSGSSALSATLKVVKHAMRCVVDVFGNRFDRGDWVIAHFRAI